mgnify:CR=1 FL=1
MYVSRMLLSRPKPKLVRLPVTVLVKLSLANTTGNEGSISTAATTDAEIYLGGIVGYLTEKRRKFPIALIQRLLKGQPVVSVGL